jgi:hypothetical protein
MFGGEAIHAINHSVLFVCLFALRFALLHFTSQKAGASTHGVLHYLTPKEMEMLDKIEASYIRLWVDISLYDGSVVKGWVYQMDDKKFPAFTKGPHNPPSERVRFRSAHCLLSATTFLLAVPGFLLV